MSCIIVEGREIDCADSAGGVAEIYVTEFTNLTQSQLVASSGSITSMSLIAGKKFWTYKLEKGNAQFDEKTVRSVDNGTTFHEQSLTFNLKKLSAKMRNDVYTLAQVRTLWIVKDNNGLIKLLGQVGGMDLGEATASTGKSFGDLNGSTITFTGMEKEPANIMSDAILAALLV